jgi:ribosomal protein S18 acetylase RimI-like enzyme
VTRISALTAEDVGGWRPLWDAYLAFYREQLPDAVTADVFARLVAGDGMHGAIAWSEGGDAVGLVHWLFHPSTWSRTSYCYLEDLYVSPAARGAGIGAALISHANAAARAAGADKLYWLTSTENAAAQRLYDRIADRTGFIHFEQRLD